MRGSAGGPAPPRSWGARPAWTNAWRWRSAGEVFSAEERQRLQDLRIPFVDASLPPEERGFTIVGVPVGEDQYVEHHLRKHLSTTPCGV